MPVPVWIKFAVCIGFDLFDMTIGRAMLGVSLMSEAATAAILFALWGPKGLFAVWEAFDITEQFDGFVPTSTIIAFMAHRK
eukprot:gene20134-25791_t